MTTFERVRGVLVREWGVDPERISPETDIDRFIVKCHDYCELISGLEDEFGREIEEAAADGFLTVADITAYFDSAALNPDVPLS